MFTLTVTITGRPDTVTNWSTLADVQRAAQLLDDTYPDNWPLDVQLTYPDGSTAVWTGDGLFTPR